MNLARQTMPTDQKARRGGKKDSAVPGLPDVRYGPPLITMLVTSLGLLVLFMLIGLITAGGSYSLISRAIGGERGASPVLGGACGVVALGSFVAAAFLGYVAFKAIRDLRTPVQYARGEVRDKKSIGGRNVGNWLAVGVRYVGSDLAEASALTDRDRAASADRSQIFQPRFASSTPTRPKTTQPASSYLPAERIYASDEASSAKSAEGAGPASESATRVVFRVDPASFANLEGGEEVIVAHSRHLQHIYYVARLREGGWESYQNRQLI